MAEQQSASLGIRPKQRIHSIPHVAMPRRAIPLRVNSSVPAAPAILTISSANAIPSPTPIEEGQPGLNRAGSKRLNRVLELLTPIKGGTSPPSPSSSAPLLDSLTASRAAADDREEEAIAVAETVIGSHMTFFTRHPLDSRNPLTFLDADFRVGGGDGIQVVGRRASTEETGDDGNDGGVRDDKASLSSLASSPAMSMTEGSPPRDIIPAPTPPRFKNEGILSRTVEDEGHDPLAGFERLDLVQQQGETENRGRRVTWATLPRPRGLDVRELQSRPMSLQELPGRFRSTESCWLCSEAGVGERCVVCGLVVEEK
ncbi:MAG: hypothetical protein Q9222_004724 [Ikaeria aurantiellina]